MCYHLIVRPSKWIRLLDHPKQGLSSPDKSSFLVSSRAPRALSLPQDLHLEWEAESHQACVCAHPSPGVFQEGALLDPPDSISSVWATGVGGAERVRDRGGCGLCTEGCTSHRPLCHQGGGKRLRPSWVGGRRKGKESEGRRPV